MAGYSALKSLKLIFLVTSNEQFGTVSINPVTFENLKQNLAPDTPGFHVLYPTRWTVRACSLKSVMDNYKVLEELWKSSPDEISYTSIKAKTPV